MKVFAVCASGSNFPLGDSNSPNSFELTPKSTSNTARFLVESAAVHVGSARVPDDAAVAEAFEHLREREPRLGVVLDAEVRVHLEKARVAQTVLRLRA